MTKWEHTSVRVKEGDLFNRTSALAHYGEQGWELVQAIKTKHVTKSREESYDRYRYPSYHTRTVEVNEYILIFKRPKVEVEYGNGKELDKT